MSLPDYLEEKALLLRSDVLPIVKAGETTCLKVPERMACFETKFEGQRTYERAVEELLHIYEKGRRNELECR